MRPFGSALMLIMDFDETLVDKDSSEWVAEQLGAAPLFHHLRSGRGMPWHQAMNAVLRTLHSQGTTIARIRHALSCLPLPSETVAALKAAHSLGCELHILSDANTFFIESVLALHGLDSLFRHIHSNPAWVDATGCLCYTNFHGATLPPHNCPFCPPNMCKGSILDTIRAAAYDPGALRIIYVGDGSGDLCPSLRLNGGDYVLPRQEYPLSLLLEEHQVKASVHPWDSLAATLQESLLEIFKCSDLDMAFNLNGPHASSSGVSSVSDEMDGDTFCKGSTVASASRFRTKLHDANSSLWRGPFRNCSFTRPPGAGQILHKNVAATRTRTPCVWKSSKGWFSRVQATASPMPLASGHTSQPCRVSCLVYFSGTY